MMDINFNFRRKVQVVICSLIAMIFGSNTYAVPIELHQNLIDNINAGTYLIDDDFTTTTSQIHSPWLVGLGVGVAICALSEDCKRDVNRAYKYLKGLFFDPQDVFVFSSIKVNDIEYLGDLITTSLLPQHNLGQFNLPGFLGGATYTATDAYSGVAFDAENYLIPGVQVGYGVLKANDGTDYFVATQFAASLLDLINVTKVEYNLDPTLPSGDLSAVSRQLRVFDSEANLAAYSNGVSAYNSSLPVPEPGFIVLLLSSLTALVGMKGMRVVACSRDKIKGLLLRSPLDYGRSSYPLRASSIV